MSSVIIGQPTGTGDRARLKAYSSFEPFELEAYLGALSGVFPDVAIEIERMPTAILTERLLCERASPGADLVLGWADTASRTFGLESIWSHEHDGRSIQASGFSTAWVVDPQALDSCSLGTVDTWASLADRRLCDRVIFPNPATSGAGFLALATLLQFYGEAEGWDLVEAIFRNVAACPGSASEPARRTGDGSIAVGVTVKIAARKRERELPRLRCVEPSDVVGVEAEVYGGLEGTRHPKVVREIMGWLSTRQARDLFEAFDKTDLQLPDKRAFKIDAASACATREAWLERFRTVEAKRQRNGR